MAIRIGNNNIGNVYFGANKIGKIFIGTQQVYSADKCLCFKAISNGSSIKLKSNGSPSLS